MLNQKNLINNIVSELDSDPILKKLNKESIKHFVAIVARAVIRTAIADWKAWINWFWQFKIYRRKQFVVKPNKFKSESTIVPARDSIVFKPSNKFKALLDKWSVQAVCEANAELEARLKVNNMTVIRRPVF